MARPTPARAAEPGRARWRAAAAAWSAITPLGRSVALTALVTWGLAVLTGWDELGVIAAACVLALAIGLLSLVLGRHQLEIALDLVTPRVVVGDTARSNVSATNPSSRRHVPARLEARVGRLVTPVRVPALAAGASHDEALLIATERRSVMPVGPVRSVSGDPLGLVRREVIWTGVESLYVHPRTAAIRSLTSGWRRDLEGETTNDRSPSDVAFHTLREYVVGDDRRHIHWRTTARQPDGKLMVREFVDTRRAHVGVVVSSNAADYRDAEEFELAMSVAASIGVRSLADEQDLTCVVGARQVPTFHSTVLLDGIAGVVLGEDTSDIAVVTGRAGDLLTSVSVAAVITGSAGESARARLAVDQLGASVSAMVIRCERGAGSMVTATSSAPIVTLGSLDELARVLVAVTE